MASVAAFDRDIESSFEDTPTAADNVLGRIIFGAQSGHPSVDDGVPTLRLRMSGDSFIEQWTGAGKREHGSFNGLVYAHDDDYLFCAGFIPASGHYTQATQRTYADAFALIERLGFQKLFRMWNFIPDINASNAEGLEVYRDFCRGRAMAFEQAGAVSMPAATGIGTTGEGVGFCFLACRERSVQHVENARQVPAYDYPAQYGPKSPSFARATQVSGQRETLYVSGTASIIGHETVHAGDLPKQWDVAIGNVSHLLDKRGFTLASLDQIKVYYRHADDLPRVMELARATFDAKASVRYLNVDICRSDLLVELEGIAQGDVS
jgi:chorismate lyase / 3-hydroxybenzoate synthase